MKPETGQAFAEAVVKSFPSDGYDASDMGVDFRRVFYGSEQGKRVLSAILVRCKVFEPLLDQEAAIDPNALVDAEGMRKIGLWLMESLEAPPPTGKQRPLSEVS